MPLGFATHASDVHYSATDSQNNVIAIGDFFGTVDFGGTILSNSLSQVFVAKYNQAGLLLWVKQYGGNSQQTGNRVAVDSAGNIVIAGSYTGTINFGGGGMASKGVFPIQSVFLV